MKCYILGLLVLIPYVVITHAGIVPNPEHPAYLTARGPAVNMKIDPAENTKEFWLNKGKAFVKSQIELKRNEVKAKNIIFFIGDGMSLATLAASRVLAGGEEVPLSFEKFPHTGLAKTYSIDKIVPDSASTSTAYLNGVKANYGTLGVNGNVPRKTCNVEQSDHTSSIGAWALKANKSIGLVTTTRVTHASPGGLYANVADRNWENNAELEKTCSKSSMKDIAVQLVDGDVGSQMTVVLGGGLREFRDETMPDEHNKGKNKRTDGKDLIEDWKNKDENEKRTFVHSREGLLAVKLEETDRLLGLFNEGHMNYKMLAEEHEPTLEEMTETAIKLLKLKSGDEGFFLFVEGGLIDVAHHGTYAQIALNETLEFSKAIEKAIALTDENETLIVVSSDHSHTMTISGYPNRGNNIFGAGHANSNRDDLPFLTLNYANGKAADKYMDLKTNKRLNPLDVIDLTKPKATFPATILKGTETHGGEDVAVFASGPWAHLFTGVYEQNVLPHMMAFAACIGEGLTSCGTNDAPK